MGVKQPPAVSSFRRKAVKSSLKIPVKPKPEKTGESRKILDPAKKKALHEDKKDLCKGFVVDRGEMEGLEFMKTTAYFLTKRGYAEKKSRDAEKSAARKGKNEEVGVGQCNVEAPRKLHTAIKAFARELRLSGNLRNALLALMGEVRFGEFLMPSELDELEAVISGLGLPTPQSVNPIFRQVATCH